MGSAPRSATSGTDQRARRNLAIEHDAVDGRRDLRFLDAQLGQLQRGLRLVDTSLRGLHVLVAVRILARARLRGRLCDDVLLLIDVELGVRLLRLSELLARLLDERALRFDVLRGRRLRGQQHLLLGLRDRVLRSLDFLVLGACLDLVEARLVGL